MIKGSILRTGHLGHLKIAGDKKINTGLVLWLPNVYQQKTPNGYQKTRFAKSPIKKNLPHCNRLNLLGFPSTVVKTYRWSMKLLGKEDILMVTTRSSCFTVVPGLPTTGLRSLLCRMRGTQTTVVSPFQFFSTHWLPNWAWMIAVGLRNWIYNITVIVISFLGNT